tara:strand:- start:8675 stop:9124 length:450 start_codon:yes stop_codon:yes gene_type:complete
MNNDDIVGIPLETFPTKDVIDKHTNGKLTVIWRDWDNIINSVPKMIYTSSVFPNEIKGPHLHLKRISYFVCIQGKVVFIIKDNNGKYHEIESSESRPVLVQVPKNIPSAHINLSEKQSTILTFSDLSWKPNDNEMIDVEFDDYDWKKWE